MALIEITQLIISLLTLMGIIFAIYKYFRDPDVKNATGLAEVQLALDFRNKEIDKEFLTIKENQKETVGRISEDLHFLRVNHIDHIEKDMREMRDKQTKILAILEAKYQIKVDN
jgi:hypothetical protein